MIFPITAWIQPPAYVQKSQTQVFQSPKFTKYQFMIPMRDGVRLCCIAYVPKGVKGPHPILLERTPYSAGPYGEDFREMYRQDFTQAGFIMAFEDVRGKYMSEGKFEDIRPELAEHSNPTEIDESTDTADTVAFLIKHVPGNNGKVGLTGISYPGFYAEMGAINTPEGLAAVSPQAPVSQWFKGDDWHHNGVLFLQDAFDFMTWFGTVDTKPSPVHNGITVRRGGLSAYDFYLQTGAMPNFDAKYYKGQIPYWNEVLKHETYDAWWKARAAGPHLTNITCPMLFVGGLFDAEDMYGALHSYADAKKQNPKTPIYLVMGPWYHGMWDFGSGSNFGTLAYGQPTSTWFRKNIELPFFQKYLQGDKTATPVAPVNIYETGANQWHQFQQWPPKDLTESKLYLGANNSIQFDPSGPNGSNRYVNDPANPTPYLADWKTSTERPTTYMNDDQTWASQRSDVLTYTSEPLTKDLTMTGPIQVKIWTSTTGTDEDLVVKVIDVYPANTTDKNPDGTPMANQQIMIRGDIMRAKFRNSFSHPEAMVPNQPTLVPFTLNSVFHDFRPGHRIMIQIQGDWFPLCNRNPNQFTDINTAPDSAYQKATVTIYYGQKYPTQISFGVLNNSGQPAKPGKS